MPYQATVYNVMIASPSDISEERGAVGQAIAKWNVVHSENRGIVLLPTEWQTHSAPGTGGHPQDIINKQVLERSDLLIGLFWTRLGTPTGNDESGSAEEINRHVGAGKPAMLYFSNRAIRPNEINADQYERLQQFKKQWSEHALLGDWDDLSEFREKFYHQLELKLNDDYFQNTSVSEIHAAGPVEPVLSQIAKNLLSKAAEGDGTIEIETPYRHIKEEDSIKAGGIVLTTRGSNIRAFVLLREAVEELEKSKLIVDESPTHHGVSPIVYCITAEGYRLCDKL